MSTYVTYTGSTVRSITLVLYDRRVCSISHLTRGVTWPRISSLSPGGGLGESPNRVTVTMAWWVCLVSRVSSSELVTPVTSKLFTSCHFSNLTTWNRKQSLELSFVKIMWWFIIHGVVRRRYSGVRVWVI